MNKLPRDVVQYLSKYIEETPEIWEVFKEFFDNSNQAIIQKKIEVLNRPAWIEMSIGGWDEVDVRKIYLIKPETTVKYDHIHMCTYKVFYIQVTVKDIVNYLNINKYNKILVPSKYGDNDIITYVRKVKLIKTFS